MSAFAGMDVTQVRELAALFDRSAGELERMRLSIDLAVAARIWLGPNALQFAARWAYPLRGQVTVVADDLNQAAGLLRQQADQQEHASGANQDTGRALRDFFAIGAHLFGQGREAIADGAGWVNDSIEDGVAWTTDLITEGVDGAADFLLDRINGHLGTIRTHQEALTVLGGNIARIFTEGRIPDPAELIASLALVGLTAAVMHSGVGWRFGRDRLVKNEWLPFERGRGVVREIYQIHAEDRPSDLGRASDKVRNGPTIPSDFSAIAFETFEAYDEAGVRVTAVRKPGEPTRYIVAIPGTDDGMPWEPTGWLTGADNARNWSDNIWAMASGRSAMGDASRQGVLESIRADMAAHGETGKPDVLLTGHSQGGMTAGNLAADRGFTDFVNVRGVLAFGAPVETADVPRDVPILSVEHRLDIVAGLDGGIGSKPNLEKVVLPAPGWSPAVNHDQDSYYQSLHELTGTPADQISGFEQEVGLEDFYASDPSHVTAYGVRTGRDVGQDDPSARY